MSAGDTVSSPIYNGGQESSVINPFAFNGDIQTTAGHNMGRASPQKQVFQSEYSSFQHTSTGSSPSDSPLLGLSGLPGDVPQSHQLFDQEYELGYTQPLQGEMLDIHSLQSPTTPPLPDYKPIPPLSPRTILATLDDIANAGPKKKSHARKQPAGHIPRPRNAFILFRCLFVSQQSVPASVEKDHRNISRIAGRVWKAMSEEDREPWIKAADIEKARHEQRWPGYRYNPVQTNPTQFKRTINGSTLSNGARAQNSMTSPIRAENISGNERLGRTLVRAQQGVQRAFKQPELPPAHYPSQQMSPTCEFPLHAPLPRIASVPPNLNAENDPRYLEALSLPLNSIHFTDPFHTNRTPTSAVDGYNNIPTPPSTYFEGSLPPDSPVVITAPSTSFGHIPHRRSSSCPPLPPPGSSGLFGSNPIMLQNSLNNPFPSIPAVDSNMDAAGLFRNPFPSNSIYTPLSLFSGVNNAPLSHLDVHHFDIVPDSVSHLPSGRHLHLDTNTRLMHRRGSSLDRAMASSTLANVFGGFSRASQHWIPWMTEPSPAQNPIIQRSQPLALPENQLATNSCQSNNPAQFPDTSLSSSDTETPGLSPSPQSSFENVAAYQAQAREIDSYNIPKELLRRTSTPKTVVAPTRSPLNETFKLPNRKVSGRLFGSQGARLGLDLDLESPLTLDISSREGAIDSHHFAIRSVDHSTTSDSTGSDSPSFPYTPASASGLSPSIFTYPYTHSLLDPELELSSREFHTASDK